MATGTATSPKLTTPVQMGLAIPRVLPSFEAVHACRRVLESLVGDLGRPVGSGRGLPRGPQLLLRDRLSVERLVELPLERPGRLLRRDEDPLGLGLGPVGLVPLRRPHLLLFPR